MLSKNKVKVINKLKSNKKKLAAYVKDPAGGLNTFWNKNDQTSNSPLPPPKLQGLFGLKPVLTTCLENTAGEKKYTC